MGVRVGTPGAPDIIGCVDRNFVGLEVKTATAKLSDEQEAFAHLLRAVGGQYHVVRSIDDAVALGYGRSCRRNLLPAERVALSSDHIGGPNGSKRF